MIKWEQTTDEKVNKYRVFLIESEFESGWDYAPNVYSYAFYNWIQNSKEKIMKKTTMSIAPKICTNSDFWKRECLFTVSGLGGTRFKMSNSI